MKKKSQALKWITIILAVILALGICGTVVSLVNYNDNKNNKVDDNYTTEVVATFDFGENLIREGTENLHSDGILADEPLEYVDGDYKLVLTDFEHVNKDAYDVVGNSCLYIGTGSEPGSFTFTVPSDITTVVIYVAGYQVYYTNVRVNMGDVQKVGTYSNRGEYTPIEIKVPSNRKITILTEPYGTRAMIDRIEFIGKVRV